MEEGVGTASWALGKCTPPTRPARSSRPHPFHSHFSRELQKGRPWQKQLCYQVLEESRNFLSQRRPWGPWPYPHFTGTATEAQKRHLFKAAPRELEPRS